MSDEEGGEREGNREGEGRVIERREGREKEGVEDGQ